MLLRKSFFNGQVNIINVFQSDHKGKNIHRSWGISRPDNPTKKYYVAKVFKDQFVSFTKSHHQFYSDGEVRSL